MSRRCIRCRLIIRGQGAIAAREPELCPECFKVRHGATREQLHCREYSRESRARKKRERANA
jgi:hypothetical protein